jgi:hypothetical protein
MMSGVRVCTDAPTFDRWAAALPGLALPAELRPVGLGRADLRPVEPRPVEPRPVELRATGPGRAEPRSSHDRPEWAVPPLVAASLALHGCAEVAITVRLTMPGGDGFGCFGLAGDLAASLVRSGPDVQIGLFDLGELVEQVVQLVPVEPPPLVDAAAAAVRIALIGADAAAASWHRVLIGGEKGWQRTLLPDDPSHLIAVSDVRRELAADLRFAITTCLTGDDGV